MKEVILLLTMSLMMTAAPKLEIIGASSVNFGKHPAKETKTASFTIKNSGDDR